MIRISVLIAIFSVNATAQSDTVPDTALFAAEFRIGPSWDVTKPAHEQRYFKDHSANLKKLRSEGRIVVGARYGEVGLIVLRGTSADDIRTLIDADSSVMNGIFKYEVNAMNVFYPGTLLAPQKKPK